MVKFRVSPKMNKIEMKEWIETAYDTPVKKVSEPWSSANANAIRIPFGDGTATDMLTELGGGCVRKQVNTANYEGKVVRRSGGKGYFKRPDYKVAYVYLENPWTPPAGNE
jgi:ribosomal protein L23